MYSFDKFVHPTDEAFAILVLENNCDRYKDMAERNDMTATSTSPKYTKATRRGQKYQSKGWSDLGKIRFQELTSTVIQYRSNKKWLEDMTRIVLKKCKCKANKRKREESDEFDTERQMNKNEMQDWNSFLLNTMDNSQWIKNTVAL